MHVRRINIENLCQRKSLRRASFVWKHQENVADVLMSSCRPPTSPEVKQLIRRMVERDPAKRIKMEDICQQKWVAQASSLRADPVILWWPAEVCNLHTEEWNLSDVCGCLSGCVS